MSLGFTYRTGDVYLCVAENRFSSIHVVLGISPLIVGIEKLGAQGPPLCPGNVHPPDAGGGGFSTPCPELWLHLPLPHMSSRLTV